MRVLHSILFVLFAVQVYSQGTIQPKPLTENRMGVVYHKEFTVDLSLHTNGYAFGVSWGKILTYYKTRYHFVQFGEIKHPKEYRQNFKDINLISGRTSNAFIYGKQNNFFLLRGGRGFRKYYTEKAKDKGVSIGITYEYGATLGLLKPYYLELKNVPDRPVGRNTSVRYSEETAEFFLDINRIFGASSFARGLDELIPVPGLNGRIGVNFEWGAYDEFIKAAELGLMLDVFARPVPIMVNQVNRPFFFNLYLTLQFGKRK
jgi:hypothetical protein